MSTQAPSPSLWNGIDPALVGQWAGGTVRRHESHARIMALLEELDEHPQVIREELAAIGHSSGRVSDPTPLPIQPTASASSFSPVVATTTTHANENRLAAVGTVATPATVATSPLGPIVGRPRQNTPVRERRAAGEMVLAFAGGGAREKVGA